MNDRIVYRETLERRECDMLAPYACKAVDTKGREREEEPCPFRTCFQRDRDRIIHSRSFRRLKHKTQVLSLPESDHTRTRLTHTLEVAQIARTISRALGLNEDLTEAIALAHDLGHTPFGHMGERALDQFLKDHGLYGFRHAEQSLRVVDHLERNGRGLNLTYEVRMGIIQHSKGQVDVSESFVMKEPSTLEAWVVRISDTVAYINHDLDDALSAGYLMMDDIPRCVLEVMGETHGRRINMLISDVVANSTPDEIKFSKGILEQIEALRAFLFERVYSHESIRQEETKVVFLLKTLFDRAIEKDGMSPREAADHISSMTDRYALQCFRRLTEPR